MSDNFIKLAKCEHCCGAGQPNGVMGGPNLGLCSYCGGSGHVPAPVPSDIPAGEAGDLIERAQAQRRIEAKRASSEETACERESAGYREQLLFDLLARLAALQQERDEAVAKVSRNEKAMDIIERASKLFLPDVEATESSLAAEKLKVAELTADCVTWRKTFDRIGQEAAKDAQRVAALVGDGRFLLDRLAEYEPDHHDHTRDYYGHVEPAIARFRAALATEA